MKSKKIILLIFLIASLAVFYSFGFYHLAKFETIDEHFWKFERIPQYWDAIKSNEWKKTYINDKPGITVALVSGIGMLLEPHPENARIRDTEINRNNLLTVYNSEKILKENLALRFPILILNGLFLVFFFWIIKKLTDSGWIAVFSVSFMAVSPVLVGISQILNPDSLLWTFSAAATFSYFALLKTNEKKFIALSFLFTGFSLLSKYSANILFPLYLLIMFSEYFINFDKYRNESGKYFLKNLLNIAIIFLGSLAVFSIFMPAVFMKIKYLYQGTIGAPGFSKIAVPMILTIFFTAIDTFIFKNYFFKKTGFWLNKNQQIILKISSVLIFLIFIAVIFNVSFGQKIIPFDKLGEDIYRNGKEIFEGVLLDNPKLLKISKELLLQFYPFVYSQLPLLLAVILFFFAKSALKGINRFKNYIFFAAFVPVIYFSALIFSNVQANIRYSIMLYPIFAFLGGIAIYEIIGSFKTNKKEAIRIAAASIVILSGIFSLWKIKPFYFNYSNFLLPEEFSIADSWGYGQYEAADYLNSLKDPQKIVIWSDTNGICQFLKGSCITNYQIDLGKVKPDYFVFSARGSVRHPFFWKYADLAKKPSEYYYQKDSAWSVNINSRLKKYVWIVASEE